MLGAAPKSWARTHVTAGADQHLSQHSRSVSDQAAASRAPAAVLSLRCLHDAAEQPVLSSSREMAAPPALLAMGGAPRAASRARPLLAAAHTPAPLLLPRRTDGVPETGSKACLLKSMLEMREQGPGLSLKELAVLHPSEAHTLCRTAVRDLGCGPMLHQPNSRSTASGARSLGAGGCG
jgi:hypothetical protein